MRCKNPGSIKSEKMYKKMYVQDVRHASSPTRRRHQVRSGDRRHAGRQLNGWLRSDAVYGDSDNTIVDHRIDRDYAIYAIEPGARHFLFACLSFRHLFNDVLAYAIDYFYQA